MSRGPVRSQVQQAARSISSTSRIPSRAIIGPSRIAGPSSLPPAASRSRGRLLSTNPDPSASPFTTINNDEISHFSKLSSEWWNEKGEFALLHRMNPVRVEYIRQKVACDPLDEPEWTFERRHDGIERDRVRGTGKWLAGKRVLDVGCGGGLLAEVSSSSISD